MSVTPDYAELVQRLRAAYVNGWGVGMSEAVCMESADAIETLLARLRGEKPITDWGIGDAGHPRFFCRKCSLIEYVQPYGRGFPPDRHQLVFDKAHARAKCDGEREYRAGVAPGLRKLVEESEAKP